MPGLALPEDAKRTIVQGVVAGDALDIRALLGEERFRLLAQVPLAVVYGHHDGDQPTHARLKIRFAVFTKSRPRELLVLKA